MRIRACLAAVALPLLLVAGCSPASEESLPGDSASDGLGAPVADVAERAGTDFDATESADRQVITSGSVTVTVDDPRDAAQEVSELVEAGDGRVEERVERAADDDRDATAYLLVRVPSTEVTPLLNELEVLGHVEDVSLTRTDVTTQVVDLDARIRARQISAERLEDLLSRATSTADLVAAEEALTQRQSELESLLSERASIADQVALSTLRIDLLTEDAVPPEEPEGFWGGLMAGWESFVDAVQAVLLAIGFLIPWLVFFALVIGGILLGLRFRKQRQAATGLPAAPTAMTSLPPPAPAAPPAPGAPPAPPESPQPPPVPPAKPQVERRTPRPRPSGPARRPPDPGPQV